MEERLKKIVGKQIRGERMTEEEKKILKAEIEKRKVIKGEQNGCISESSK